MPAPPPESPPHASWGLRFASDNTAPVHPAVMAALLRENELGWQRSYGDDHASARLNGVVKEIFGGRAEALAVFNGTGANILSLMSATGQGRGVIGSDVAHVFCDEAGALASVANLSYCPLPHVDGKISADGLKDLLDRTGDVHKVLPGIVTLTQPTEYGTVYSWDEMVQIISIAHAHGLRVHVDGARLFQAAAALGVGLGELTTDLEVDVVSLGATKAGAMSAECVVVIAPDLIPVVTRFRKITGQLASKSRFVSAQVLALLEGDLWRETAEHANAMAARLAQTVEVLPGFTVSRPVQTNAVFVAVAETHVASLVDQGLYFAWNEPNREVRWMTSFATRETDVDELGSALKGEVEMR